MNDNLYFDPIFEEVDGVKLALGATGYETKIFRFKYPVVSSGKELDAIYGEVEARYFINGAIKNRFLIRVRNLLKAKPDYMRVADVEREGVTGLIIGRDEALLWKPIFSKAKLVSSDDLRRQVEQGELSAEDALKKLEILL